MTDVCLMRLLRLQLCGLAVLGATGIAQAESCRAESFRGASYVVCNFNPAKDHLRTYWRGNDGRPYRTFDALAADLKAKGKSLRFAMNGGMYRGDLSPVGLYIENSIHPAFIVNSTDRKPRDGVGLSSRNKIFFVITKSWVSFYDFARFFRDRLGCSDALFLDGGEAPGLYAPELGRNDSPAHGGYGPIVGVTE